MKRAKPDTPTLPDKKYDLILADPPWEYDTRHSGRAASVNAAGHYPTMSIDEICALPVADLAKENCVLLMWATSPMLKKACRVIEDWGFSFKTVFLYWIKTDAGGNPRSTPGFHTNGSVELLLLGTRGRIKNTLRGPNSSHKEKNVLFAPAPKEHSAKPAEALRRVLAVYDRTPDRIELFARKRHSTGNPHGFDAWGLEVATMVTDE